MRIASKMKTLSNDKELLKILLKDKTSAGNWATIAFLESYLYYQTKVRPEDFETPVLLTQPEKDRWTPLELSQSVVSKLKPELYTEVILPNGGHYPTEPEALIVLHEAANKFIQKILDRK